MVVINMVSWSSPGVGVMVQNIDKYRIDEFMTTPYLEKKIIRTHRNRLAAHQIFYTRSDIRHRCFQVVVINFESWSPPGVGEQWYKLSINVAPYFKFLLGLLRSEPR